jgi:hypothetical protein
MKRLVLQLAFVLALMAVVYSLFGRKPSHIAAVAAGAILANILMFVQNWLKARKGGG